MSKKRRPYVEVEDITKLSAEGDTLRRYAFQGVDFGKAPEEFLGKSYRDCCFLGCSIPAVMEPRLGKDCLVLGDFGKNYNVFPSSLYTPETLYEGFDPLDPSSYEKCYDGRVYADYLSGGKTDPDIKEALCRTLHDFSICDALGDFVSNYDPSNIIAVMGGHAMSRTEENYLKVARISKTLTERGKLMVSGGGPGAMEATHLGAWMAGRDEKDLLDAMEILGEFPTFRDGGWLESAFKIRSLYPRTDEKYRSLGIPTWLYGHEPSTPFATDIAKLFNNSVREDKIITVPYGGIIYSPGSAGTIREIFQDAEQNHYKTLGVSSPMVFLGVDFYTKDLPVFKFLQELLCTERYKNLDLYLSDDVDEIIEALL